MGRRVAVTGMGVVSPLGVGVEPSWGELVRGQSGVGPITLFDVSAYSVRFAAEVADWDPTPWVEPKEIKKLDRCLQFAIAAGLMAWEQSGLDMDRQDPHRVGVYVGSGVGGMRSLEEGTLSVNSRGPRRVSPFLIPAILINLASGQLSIRLGVKGANLAHVTACATSNHSIGEAVRAIRHGYLDVVVAGGTEAGITPLAVAGFARMQALSTRNDDPQRASRPFDAGRDGFVMGEGSGILVLEEWEQARARGADILAELLGYGASSDAHHITAPLEDGAGASRCMENALQDAAIPAEAIDYVNAHGTSTPYNDSSETRAMHRVFGAHADSLTISSTKSCTGHALGAAGGLEAAFCIQALRTGVVPPTINLDEPDPECDLDYCANEARDLAPKTILSNGLGFGGTNASLIFGKV